MNAIDLTPKSQSELVPSYQSLQKVINLQCSRSTTNFADVYLSIRLGVSSPYIVALLDPKVATGLKRTNHSNVLE